MHPIENQCHKFAGLPLLIGAATFAALAVALQVPAQQTTSNAPVKATRVTLKYVNIKDVSPDSGQKMYVAYCAACHGTTAKGDGPAAQALRERPTDLTMLSARNGGKFPETLVWYLLTENAPLSSNGSAQMPNWCPAFRSLNKQNPSLVDLRAHNLANYLKSLQVPNPNNLRSGF